MTKSTAPKNKEEPRFAQIRLDIPVDVLEEVDKILRASSK